MQSLRHVILASFLPINEVISASMRQEDDQEVALEYLRLEVLRLQKVHFIVFWVTRRDILVGEFKRFGVTFCRLLQEEDTAPEFYVQF